MSTAADLQQAYADNIYNLIRYRTVTAPMAQYKIAMLGQQSDRTVRDSRIKFERGKTSLFTPLNAAGLENSGVATVHVGNYLADQARNEANIQAQYDEARNSILAELAAERANLALATGQDNIDALRIVGVNAAGGLG